MTNKLIRFLIILIPIIPLYLIGKELLWNNEKIFWFLSYYYLIFVLLVTPVSKLFLKCKKIKKYSNKIINYRRPIWILAWLLAILHLINTEENIRNLWLKFYIDKTSYIDFLLSWIFWWWWESIIGMNFYAFWWWVIGFVIMTVLLITSNDISQKIIGAKFWKYLQRLIYPLFILVIIHIYFIWWWKGLYLFPWLILICLKSYIWFDEKYEKKGGLKNNNRKYKRFLCLPCGYIYDEELWDIDWWLMPWTKYEDIPNNWSCPVCWASKKDFIPLDWHYNPEIMEDHELELVLESKNYLTDDVVELVVLCKRDLEIKPWQFCNLIFKKWKNKITRSYSIANYVDNSITFLIRLKEGGKWSTEIRRLKIWDKIKALWPYWDFVLRNTSKKKIFIATGTWLSPIYNMLLNSWETEKELYFWIRYKKDIFYTDKLRHIPNLKVFTYLSWEEIKWYRYGRINTEMIDVWKNDEVYICWNPELVEKANETLKKKQIDNIYIEKFL